MKPIFVIDIPPQPKTIFALGDEHVDIEKTGEKALDRYLSTLDKVHLKTSGAPVEFDVIPLDGAIFDQLTIDAISAADNGDGNASAAATYRALQLAAFRRGVVRVGCVPQVVEGGAIEVGDLDPRFWHKIPQDMRAEIGTYVIKLSSPEAPPAEVSPDDTGK